MVTCTNCNCSCITDIFTNEDFRLLNQNKTEIIYNEGDIILKQGSYVSQVLFLKEGLAKIILEAKNGKNTILKIVNHGNFIALPVLGEQTNYPVSVISLSPTNVCQIKKDCMLEIMANNVQASQYIINWFSHDYLFLYSKISTLSTRNNHGKLASALMYLSNDRLKNSHVFKYLTRKDLAGLSSISLESVNRILLELKNDKIIEYDHGCIQILKPDLLKRLSEIG